MRSSARRSAPRESSNPQPPAPSPPIQHCPNPHARARCARFPRAQLYYAADERLASPKLFVELDEVAQLAIAPARTAINAPPHAHTIGLHIDSGLGTHGPRAATRGMLLLAADSHAQMMRWLQALAKARDAPRCAPSRVGTLVAEQRDGGESARDAEPAARGNLAEEMLFRGGADDLVVEGKGKPPPTAAGAGAVGAHADGVVGAAGEIGEGHAEGAQGGPCGAAVEAWRWMERAVHDMRECLDSLAHTGSSDVPPRDLHLHG